MFITYREKVFETYKKKKEKGILSLNLSEPTPSKLKNESQIVYSERYKEKDAGTLRVFFPLKGGTTDYGVAIRNIDIDKFKPLIKFLKGQTSDTNDKNIEILAWLIDFKERPYDSKYNYSDILIEESEIKENIDTEIINNDEIEQVNISEVKEDLKQPDSGNSGNSGKIHEDQIVDIKEITEISGSKDEKVGEIGQAEVSPPKRGLKEILIGSVMAVSIAFGGYFALNNGSDIGIVNNENKIANPEIQGEITLSSTHDIKQKDLSEVNHEKTRTLNVIDASLKNNRECMYWNEDHYQKIPCDDKNITGAAIALDEHLLMNFKKITFPDTISEKSINHLWYLKSDNKMEFFTEPGNHPTKKTELKKLSKYIFQKYIKGN